LDWDGAFVAAVLQAQRHVDLPGRELVVALRAGIRIGHLCLGAIGPSHAQERRPSASAGVIGSQSVNTTKSGGPRGYDAGKKIKRRKRHIGADTQGNLVGLVAHEADIQDRDGAPSVPASIRSLNPPLRRVFADGGYAALGGQKPRILTVPIDGPGLELS
jgi:hypothetical protein